jgi:L-histidine N-alpha-methyltransferase
MTMSALTVERHLDADDAVAQFAEDVRTGLTRSPKELPPRWFYDDRGSELFERITRLPEYYPTRRERAILERHGREIAAAVPVELLVELGAGSAEKTRLLIDALAGQLQTYAPVDVSENALLSASLAIAERYPDLSVHAVIADFERHLGKLPRSSGPRLVAFLGGTIGNFAPAARAEFFRGLAGLLQPPDALLLGTDLVKSVDRLLLAYDDPTGVTAEFNRNMLSHINRELGADFDLDAFRHIALWNDREEWIEMRLESVREQLVTVKALDLTVRFGAGEQLRTEISAKFRRDRLEREFAAAGLSLAGWWTDPAGDFALSLARLR